MQNSEQWMAFSWECPNKDLILDMAFYTRLALKYIQETALDMQLRANLSIVLHDTIWTIMFWFKAANVVYAHQDLFENYTQWCYVNVIVWGVQCFERHIEHTALTGAGQRWYQSLTEMQIDPLRPMFKDRWQMLQIMNTFLNYQ